MQNILDFNFDRVPRFYKIMLFFQLTRARDTYNIIALLLKNMQLAIVTQQLTLTVFQLFLIVHCFGCFWYATTELNIYTKVNWVAENGIANQPIVEKYMASMYWATVTCTTVGYGDILPTNGYELVWALLIIVFGVAIFSYFLSNMAAQFSEFSKTNAANQERIQQIEHLDQQFQIGPELVEKLTNYFTNGNKNELEVETNQEMSYLLQLLPSTLKTQLAKFLYMDAIVTNRFLQNRDDNFYSKYLEELQSEKFNANDLICKQGSQPECMYFIMSGVVKNTRTMRYFQRGQMINHDCILKRTKILDNFVAETEVTMLRYERETFLLIVDQFPDVKDDMNQMLRDQEEQMINDQFFQSAIHDNKTKNAILDNYRELISEEKR